MTKRIYNQYCAVARGLDAIGNRWTLLLVRELLLGPKRYRDLLAASPGIGTNLLADKLREMENVGVVERATLPPPFGSTVYRLTELGGDLEPIVRAIGYWGRKSIGSRRDGEHLSPGAYFVAFRETFRANRAGGLREVYEFRVEGRVFEVRVEEGACATSEGGSDRPDCVFTIGVEGLNKIFLGEISAEQAITDGIVEVLGDTGALARFQDLFAIPDTGISMD